MVDPEVEPATVRRHLVNPVEAARELRCTVDLGPVELDGDGVAAQLPLQRLGRSLDDDLAARDDRDPAREPVGLLEVVRREQDRQALGGGEALELLPHRGARLRVEAGRGLVEEQDLRAVDEPHGHVEPAASSRPSTS